MAITLKQIESLGFKPTKKGGGFSKHRKYDTFIYPINKTDYLYIGYNPFKREINNKTIWKSIMTDEGRLNYQVINIGETGFGELKDFIQRCLGVRMTPPYEQENKVVQESIEEMENITKSPEPAATAQEIKNFKNNLELSKGTNSGGYVTITTTNDAGQYNS